MSPITLSIWNTFTFICQSIFEQLYHKQMSRYVMKITTRIIVCSTPNTLCFWKKPLHVILYFNLKCDLIDFIDGFSTYIFCAKPGDWEHKDLIDKGIARSECQSICSSSSPPYHYFGIRVSIKCNTLRKRNIIMFVCLFVCLH